MRAAGLLEVKGLQGLAGWLKLHCAACPTRQNKLQGGSAGAAPTTAVWIHHSSCETCCCCLACCSSCKHHAANSCSLILCKLKLQLPHQQPSATP